MFTFKSPQNKQRPDHESGHPDLPTDELTATIQRLRADFDRAFEMLQVERDNVCRLNAIRTELSWALRFFDPTNPLLRRPFPESVKHRIDALERRVRNEVFNNFKTEGAYDRLQALMEENITPIIGSTGDDQTVKAITAMLPAFDSLLLAISSGTMPDIHKEGLKLAITQFRDGFIEAGATLLDPIGEKFDPLYHEAVMEVPATSPENKGSVDAVQRFGIKVGKRLLRPALVVVSV